METFAKSLPYELALENADVRYVGETDTAVIVGDAAKRAYTFSTPVRLQVTCGKTGPLALSLHHTDNLPTTFELAGGHARDGATFDLDATPRGAAEGLARGDTLALGDGVTCTFRDLDTVLRLSASLREAFIPRLVNGNVRSVSVTATETSFAYAARPERGLDPKALYEDARTLLALLEQRRRLAKGDKPFPPDETSAAFAEKLARVATTDGYVAKVTDVGPKKRVVSFRAVGVEARAVLQETKDETTLALELVLPEHDGAFHLHHDHQARDEGKTDAAVWAESEMRVFLSKNAFVSSASTRAEVRFLFDLPKAARDEIVLLCTKYDCDAIWKEGTLTLAFRELAQFLFYAEQGRTIDAAEIFVSIASNMAVAARAFPKRAEGSEAETSPLPELVGCTFCRALFFRAASVDACIRCGAPVADVPVAALQNQEAP